MNTIPRPRVAYFQKNFPETNTFTPGSELAFFHLGSTVVLIFESPSFEFSVQPHQKVRFGEPIGQSRLPALPSSS